MDEGGTGLVTDGMRRGEMLPGDSDAPSRKNVHGVTWRAVLVGALLVAGFSAADPFCSRVLGYALAGNGSLMSGPVLALFVLLLANGLLKRSWPRVAFSLTELLVVYGMLVVSLGWLNLGGQPFLMAMITYPFYMASSVNGWEHSIWPSLPPWSRFGDLNTATWYWEGKPAEFSIPWSAWQQPAVHWGIFTLALLAAMFCMAILLRKDWIERQRLTFPLAGIPLALLGDDPTPSLASSVMRNRVFWIGFGPPALLAVLAWLHSFIPDVPTVALSSIPIGQHLSGAGLPWSVLGNTVLTLSWSALGIACLIPSNIALSIWFFYVFNQAQAVAWAAAGAGADAGTGASPLTQGFIPYEEGGALLALAAVLVYESRHSLKAAWHSLVRREETIDPYAPLTNRQALVGLVLTSCVMLSYGLWAGMSWWSFCLLMGLFAAVLLVGSRLVAASGVLVFHTGLFDFEKRIMLAVVGSSTLGMRSLVMSEYLTMTYMNDPGTLMMPQTMNAFKLGHAGQVRGRPFAGGMLLAIAVVVVVGMLAYIRLGYRVGISNTGDWPFAVSGRYSFGEVDSIIRFPRRPHGANCLAMGAGAAFMLLLTGLQSRFLWWPLSPIGFTIASGWATTHSLWFSTLVGWAGTNLVRRYGGLRLYRQLRPAFLGLILGDYFGEALAGITRALLTFSVGAG